MSLTSYVYVLILGILIFDFLLDQWLEYLNKRHWSEVIPEKLAPVYSQAKYEKAQRYEQAKNKLGLISSSFSFIVILSLLLMGGFGYIDEWLRTYTSHPIALPILFFGLILVGSDLIGTPFSIYGTFGIEQQFGFNKTTPFTYLLDKLKSLVLMALLGGILLGIIIYIYEKTGNFFWLYTWLVISGFMLLMTLFYSQLIVPLFNKQTPLEEGELKQAITAFATKVDFDLEAIFVINGSKRSTKANAYFSGLGKKKRIVLYDTLIKNHSTEELVAILAHEIGHYKMKHTQTGLFMGIGQMGILLFILSLFIAKESSISLALAQALGGKISSFHLGVVGFSLLYSPLSQLTSLITNALSRKNEYQADAYAATHYQPEALQQALIKLSAHNLSNLHPHPWYVFFHYSHPPLIQRLQHLDKFNQ